MLWALLWGAVLVVAIAGVIVSIGNVRMSRRVAREARALWDAAPAGGSNDALDATALEDLPAPVRRYMERVLRGRTTPVRAVRLLHGGTFRPNVEGEWMPIRGQQYFSTDPPGFVWWGRITIVPGFWIEARDRSFRGQGNMLIKVASTWTLGDASGEAMDQGALQRLLAEMAWFPTAFLDRRYVRWVSIDERRAEAHLTVEGHEGAVIFEFDDEGLPARISAQRYRDADVLTPWGGRVRDFRVVAGLLVPHEVEVFWEIDGREQSYARFLVEKLEYDRPALF